MDPNILYIIIGVAALIIGIVAGKLVFAKDTKKKIEEAELHAQTLIKEAELRAETIRKEKELSAKERFVQLKSDYEAWCPRVSAKLASRPVGLTEDNSANHTLNCLSSNSSAFAMSFNGCSSALDNVGHPAE